MRSPAFSRQRRASGDKGRTAAESDADDAIDVPVHPRGNLTRGAGRLGGEGGLCSDEDRFLPRRGAAAAAAAGCGTPSDSSKDALRAMLADRRCSYVRVSAMLACACVCLEYPCLCLLKSAVSDLSAVTAQQPRRQSVTTCYVR